MTNVNFHDAMDQAREQTDALLDDLSEHLLTGTSIIELSQEIYATLMRAPHDLVVNSLTWMVTEAALNRAAERGAGNDDSA